MLKPFLTPKSIWSYNPIPTGCVLYLPLWHPSLSGPVFKSIDPYGHTCTVVGGALYSGDLGRYFDKDDDKINLGTNAALNLGNTGDEYTMIAWAKAPATDAELMILYKTINPQPMRMAIEAGGKAQCILYDGVNNPAVSSTTDCEDNVFHHLCGRVDRGTKIYINVDGADEQEAVDSTGVADLRNTNALLLGEKDDGGAPFGGYIGEVWVYDYLLSDAEVLYHYNKTKFRYT